jgi:uncharacterized membrane protein YfcA
MASNDIYLGVLAIVGASICLLSGLNLLSARLFDEPLSLFFAFVLLAVGMHFLSKK